MVTTTDFLSLLSELRQEINDLFENHSSDESSLSLVADDYSSSFEGSSYSDYCYQAKAPMAAINFSFL